jgi:hypothetical protein
MEDLAMNVEMLVHELNPAPSGTVPGPDSFEAQLILTLVLAESQSPRRRRLLVSTLSLGVLAGAAGVALLILALLPAETPSAAAATFAHLANVARHQPGISTPGAGQFQYTDSESAYEHCTLDRTFYCYLLPQRRQIWIGADRSGRILESFGSPSFVTPADHDAWVKDGSPTIPTAPQNTTFAPGGLSLGPTDLAKLPTDPETLGSELSSRKIEGGPPGPAEDFVQIGDLLEETDASPSLRSALYQVAENVPGVRVLGTVTDHSGRRGMGVSRVNAEGVKQEYIFDPTTSALLGEEELATRANAERKGVPKGTVLSWAVYLSSGIVNSLSDTPTGTAPPASEAPVWP